MRKGSRELPSRPTSRDSRVDSGDVPVGRSNCWSSDSNSGEQTTGRNASYSDDSATQQPIAPHAPHAPTMTSRLAARRAELAELAAAPGGASGREQLHGPLLSSLPGVGRADSGTGGPSLTEMLDGAPSGALAGGRRSRRNSRDRSDSQGAVARPAAALTAAALTTALDEKVARVNLGDLGAEGRRPRRKSRERNSRDLASDLAANADATADFLKEDYTARARWVPRRNGWGT